MSFYVCVVVLLFSSFFAQLDLYCSFNLVDSLYLFIILSYVSSTPALYIFRVCACFCLNNINFLNQLNSTFRYYYIIYVDHILRFILTSYIQSIIIHFLMHKLQMINHKTDAQLSIHPSDLYRLSQYPLCCS